MKTIARVLAGPVAMMATSVALAQAPVYTERSFEQRSQQGAYEPPAAMGQQQLDQILAPVALYPDSLLSQLLMAATYPRDVAEAAQWSRANSALQGDDAVRAVERESWDPSVKSMVAFPEILVMMGERLDWTQQLGDAFLAQEGEVMRTVQELRQRADQAGNLRSSEQLQVERVGEDYVIEPPSAETVYVPYYDPRVVYGEPWWPDYQPVYWSPWPGYAYGAGFGFGWGRGIYLHRNFFYGGFDWGRRHVRYSGHRPYYYGGGNYWRGWRDRRHDGRTYTRGRDGGDARQYSRERSPGAPRYERRDWGQRAEGGSRVERSDGNVRRWDGRNSTERAGRGNNERSARNDIDRGGRDFAARSAQVQRSARVQQGGTPRSVAPRQSVQRNNAIEPAARAPRAEQSSPRSGNGSRGGDASRGGGERRGGGGGGGGRDRDR